MPSPGVEGPPRGVYDVLVLEVGVASHELARLEIPAPASNQVGYELGEQAWQAELAWPPAKVAVIAPGPEAGGMHAASRRPGWDARLPGDWPPEELAPASRAAGGSR